MERKVYSVMKINIFVIFVGCISSSYCINSGLISELKHLSPMVIKYSQNAPVFLNTKSEGQHVTREMVHKIQVKPPPKVTKRFSRSIWPVPKLPLVPFMLPLIPQSPFLSMFPNWMPQLPRSALAMNPGPIIKLSHLLRWTKRNTKIHEKLLELKHKGTLTTAEYVRFQNLLLRL